MLTLTLGIEEVKELRKRIRLSPERPSRYVVGIENVLHDYEQYYEIEHSNSEDLSYREVEHANSSIPRD